jgi:excisionase family DNA binding protein
MSTSLENYATVSDVAERLNIHPESVRRLIKQGKIPAIKIFNRRWLVERHILEQYAAHYDTRPRHAADGFLFDIVEGRE